MFFFFRTPKIYVDLLTTDPSVYKYSRPDYAVKFIPEWLKNTKGLLTDGISPLPTIKRCPGLLDMYKRGIIKPMWHDLAIQINSESKTYNWESAPGYPPSISDHVIKQWETFVSPNKYAHMKLNSPWLIRTKKSLFWQTMPCYWNDRMQDNYHIVPGILDTKYVNNMNINMFLKYEPSRKFMIPINTPIDHYMPLTESKIKIKHHLISEQEYYKIETYKAMFTGQYNSKVADDRKKSKCPFSF